MAQTTNKDHEEGSSSHSIVVAGRAAAAADDHKLKTSKKKECSPPTYCGSSPSMTASSSTVHQHTRRPQQRPLLSGAKTSSNNELTKYNSKKKVAFSKQISVSFTISRQDITPNEMSCVWYSEQEYHKIYRACLKQIQKLDRGEILKDKKYCARGLENKTFIASISQQMHRNLAYKVVLEEQDRQRREGISVPECISSLYYSISSSSQIWANAMALTDQRLAKANEDENTKNTSREEDNKSHSCNHVDNPPQANPRSDFFIDKSSNSLAPFPSRIPQTIILLELARAA